MFDDYFEEAEVFGCEVDDDEEHVEYSKLDTHPRAAELEVNFDATKRMDKLTVAEKTHYDEVYAEIKFVMFFEVEPTNNRHWYSYPQHNIRVHGLYKLAQEGKIQLHGFDGTASMCQLKTSAKTEVTVPAEGAFVVTLEDKTEIVIRLTRGNNSIEWSVFCKNAIEYSRWDKVFRAAYKEYNQYKNQVFDQDGNFISLPNVTFDDIFLEESIRTAVQTNIIDYVDEKMIRLKMKNGIPSRRGVILSGIPGTGKTFLSRVLANTLGTSFMVVSNISSLRELRTIFKFAAQFTNIILLLEDIDIYMKHRDFGSELLSTLLNSLDGIETTKNHMVVMCSTNNVEVFDEALKDRPGRFDITISFGTPSEALKATMLEGFCKGKDVTDVDFSRIAARIPQGYTGAHLKELYISASVLAIEENSVDDDGAVKLTTETFNRALDRMKGCSKRAIGFESAGSSNDNKG